MSNVKPEAQGRANASRKNGEKSRGPTSPEGKARSAKNSRKHGLTGKVELDASELGDFHTFIAKLNTRYGDGTPKTAALIDRAATAALRLNRARHLITQTLEDLADPQNSRRVEERAANAAIVQEIRSNMQEMYGGKPPSLFLARAVAEEGGYVSKTSRATHAAVHKLMLYARRFRGERDRALSKLEGMRKLAS